MSGRVSNIGGDGDRQQKAISFVQRHTNSEAFKALFREGMTLVEEAAGYLDGPGRAASKALRRPAALAYATESMRLTTRLMQIASWLLLRRAVNEGEITSAAGAERAPSRAADQAGIVLRRGHAHRIAARNSPSSACVRCACRPA